MQIKIQALYCMLRKQNKQQQNTMQEQEKVPLECLQFSQNLYIGGLARHWWRRLWDGPKCALGHSFLQCCCWKNNMKALLSIHECFFFRVQRAGLCSSQYYCVASNYTSEEITFSTDPSPERQAGSFWADQWLSLSQRSKWTSQSLF